ncbi:Arc family DNA-binding protein [Pseudoxanthomonas winnipegensis]|uniref:Arc family DNA-binding protein n=1 Tax=Pseudoxanthomonas winnipegensis TaxID=2480810 RepID=A0A4Q8LAC4_9GAMM|nr:Arc family DNA-binding protein [Pseudoxanthomonas winnipegensis]RZZ81429.1 Arc family DNA-binding protein [Pseudoxanthomonas winnipegensis]TAA25425.1 Arc family DNA-binding protein [Pseudoxanthomonas winnipegensis]
MKVEEVRSQFRIPAALYAWLKDKARREHRSINGQLASELTERMKQAQQKEPTP